jgi:hypothetical protein
MTVERGHRPAGRCDDEPASGSEVSGRVREQPARIVDVLEDLRANRMRRPAAKAFLGLNLLEQISLKEKRARNLLSRDIGPCRTQLQAENLSPRKRVPNGACKVAGPGTDVEHPLRRAGLREEPQDEPAPVLLGRIPRRSLGVCAPVSVPVVEAGAGYGLPFLLGSSSVGSPNGLKKRSG